MFGSDHPITLADIRNTFCSAKVNRLHCILSHPPPPLAVVAVSCPQGVKMSPKNSLSIRLTEPVVFLRGSAETTVTGRRTTRESQPAMLRGLLTLTLDKPTKISSIEITLQGRTQTAWPEGMHTVHQFSTRETLN